MQSATLLIVEPTQEHRVRLEPVLQPFGFCLRSVRTCVQALEELRTSQIPVVITVSTLPDGCWQDLWREAKRVPSPPNLILVHSPADRRSRSELLKGGAYDVLSDPVEPAGVRFVVERAAQEWLRRSHLPESQVAPPRRSPARCERHVLVVDDDGDMRNLIGEILRAEGLEVRVAENGSQAVDLIRVDPDITVTILDWRMPGITGERILDQLTAIRPSIRVIVASGSGGSDVENAFAGRRVLQFVAKPFDYQTLVSAVRLALTA